MMERGEQPEVFYDDVEGKANFKTEYEILPPNFLLTHRVQVRHGADYLQSISYIETREKITAKSGSVWKQIDNRFFVSFDESEILLLNWNEYGRIMRYSLIEDDNDDSKQEGVK